MQDTAMIGAPRTWAVYCRLSRKPAGRQRNDHDTVEQQERRCRRYAAQHGLVIDELHIYVDNHRTAWHEDGERPAWDQMLKAAKAGAFGGILAYKLDRFARNGPDGYALCKLGEEGLVIDGPNSGRVDLGTGHGRKVVRDTISAAEAESDNTSDRARDELADRTARGLQLGGGRLFGFEILSRVREFEDDVDPVQRPAEADLIREAARRHAIDGEAWEHIAADWNARGLRTVRGGPWDGSNLARTVAAPRNGGYVMLHGQTVGRNAGEPVLDRELYAALQEAMGKRRRGPRPKGLWPLTGTPRCGNTAAAHEASRAMSGTRASNGSKARKYICSIGNGGCGLTILAEPVEEAVRARVLARLAQPDARQALADAEREAADERGVIHAEIKRLTDELGALEARRIRKEIREAVYEVSKATVDELLTAEEARLEALGRPSAGGALPPAMTAEEYDALTVAARRELIARLGIVVRIDPHPAGAPRNRYVPERVQITG